jgi:hypothetical protein
LIQDDQLRGVYHHEMDAVAEGYWRLGNIPFLVRVIVDFEASAPFTNGNVGLGFEGNIRSAFSFCIWP